VGLSELTEATLRYLFATTWLPCDVKRNTVAVPDERSRQDRPLPRPLQRC